MLLRRLNERPFRKREGSRASLFAQLDKPALQPLPDTDFEFGKWKTTRVDFNYHVAVERHFYSVPHALAQQEGEVRTTAHTVEVICRGVRVASQVLSGEPEKATTLTEHMPKSQQKYVGRTPSGLVAEARQIGPFTGQLVEATRVAKWHPEQGYRSSLGIPRLAKTHPAERMEAAARRALRARAYSSASRASILRNQLDRLPLDGDPVVAAALNPAVAHHNIRGAGYFDTVG